MSGWLNPTLNPQAFREAYEGDGWVQIPDLLAPQIAEALADALERATPWRLVHSGPAGEPIYVDAAALEPLHRSELQARLQETGRRAAAGFAYLYYVYPMIEAYLGGRDPGHPLHRVTEFLNGPEFMAFAHEVTGEPVVKVDAQASHYRPGHYLTLHDDRGDGERRAAYTIGLTREWRPDWGGQLLFHDAMGDVTRGFTPKFNVLTLFKTPQWHSVAPVAPYAARPRFAITGWLRDDPPYAAKPPPAR
ncbi:2OG-Fe(II) oxygenase [Phenylobacterium sp. J426]|uniref:2OG-Fe(II) oxygenase n=1 Tax=Phenylobacterium sp. J426 TaxID=2898439 RepID=UPI002151B637|nr:2OG-Fe(II) oxygenase family protein [Phenylobacterium sp. J426]MCR5875005.1 2OG-Fe(II) oxygenase [Phenylobacterium sp. J426]